MRHDKVSNVSTIIFRPWPAPASSQVVKHSLDMRVHHTLSAPHNYVSISTIADQVIKHECCLVIEYATFHPWHTPPALQRLFVCVPLAFRRMHECFKVRGRLQNHLFKNPNPQPQSRMAVAAYHVFKPRPELFSTQVQAIVSVTRQADENQV